MKQVGLCLVLGETHGFYFSQSGMIRENLKERKKGDIDQIIGISLCYLVPRVDHFTVSISNPIDYYSDQANGGALYVQLHHQEH